MTRQTLLLLFFITGIYACKPSYELSEGKSGYVEIKDQANDGSIEKKIQPYRDSLAKQMNEVIGVSEMEMTTGQPESLLGNFVCDLMMEYDLEQEKQQDREVEYFPLVLMNYRGLRASLPKGEITVKNIFEIMPFENALAFADMKGSTILEMTKFLIDYGGQPVSSNFRITVEADKTLQVTINGNPIDTNAIYTVITTDYLVNGGDKMNFFSKATSINQTNIKLRDVLLEQIKIHTTNELKITSALDGRITFK